jgi:hypothetical protein
MFASWWRDSVRQTAPSRRPRRISSRCGTVPVVERLEDRTVLSNAIPLSPLTWTPIPTAPFSAPIQNGQDPGSQPVSGRVTDLAIDPSTTNTYYLAAAGGGVWKTTDGGTTWSPLTDGQATLNMGAIAVTHTGSGTIIYAGTGEANLGVSKTALNRDNIYPGQGILVSTNGGSTWTLNAGPSNAFVRQTFSRIVIDPTDVTGQTAYAAVGANATNSPTDLLGHPINKGVYKTTNGGGTWTLVTGSIAGSSDTAFSDLAIAPSGTIYAAIGAPDDLGQINGIYESTNGGGSWTKLSGGAPDGAVDSRVGRITLALATNSPNILYAAVAETGAGGHTAGALREMVTTTNGGTTWNLLAATPNYMGSAGDYDTALLTDPNGIRVYAAGQDDIITSANSGANWTNIDTGANGVGPHGDYHALVFDQSGRVLEGSDGGIWVLNNPTSPGTRTWTDLNNDSLNTVQETSVAQNGADPNLLFAGTQDNGTIRFDDPPDTWATKLGGDGGFVRVIPGSTSPTVFSSFFYPQPPNSAAGFLVRSTDGGNSWTSITSGINTSSDHANFYPPYVIDPVMTNRLVLGTDHVYETFNDGTSWSQIGGPGTPGWTATAVVDAVAVAPGNVNIIYAAAGGQVFVTVNGGATWTTPTTPPVSPVNTAVRFRDLLVTDSTGMTAYVVAGNFNDVTGGSQVWRTTNGGVTWTAIGTSANGFPNEPSWALALDPNYPGSTGGALYVGTDTGVYITTNPTAATPTWTRLGGTSLPNVQVHNLDLNTQSHILAAATNGRGVWEIFNRPTDLNWVGGSTAPTTSSTNTDTTFQVNYTYNVDPTYGPVPDNFTVGFYASLSGALPSNPSANPTDTIFLGSQVLTSATDKAVGLHSETSPALRIGRAGNWHLVTVLDPNDYLTEVNETNNIIADSSIMITAGSGTKGDGLLAYYYPNTAFTGPAVVRTDATVNLPVGYGKYALDPNFGKNSWGARWVGQVLAPVTGTYTFTTVSDDGVRLYVDGQQIINDFTGHPPTTDSGTIALVAGQKYDLWMDYFQGPSSDTAQLLWTPPGSSQAVIPQDDLFSTRATAPLTLVAPYNGDNQADLWVFVPQGPNGLMELRIFSQASGYITPLLSTSLPLQATDPATFLNAYAFDVADFNHDGKADLYVIIKNNSAGTNSSGMTEVHVLDGANKFQTFLLHVATALGPTGSNWTFQVADFNHDGAPDLIGFVRNTTGSGRTEIHVLSGATQFQTFLLHQATALPYLDASAVLRLGAFGGDGAFDLYFIPTQNTGSGMTEVHVLSQASNYQTFVLHVATVLGPVGTSGNSFDMGLFDYDHNGSLDLFYLPRFNTGSARVEVHVLSGSTLFQTFLTHLATEQPASGAFGEGPLEATGSVYAEYADMVWALIGDPKQP